MPYSITYNDFGWARANSILTPKEHAVWKSKLHKKEEYPKNGNRYVIPAGEEFGIDNVLVYTRGTYLNPIIDMVVKIDASRIEAPTIAMAIEKARDYFDNAEGTYREKSRIVNSIYRYEVFDVFTKEDSKSFSEYSSEQSGDRSRANYVFDEDDAGEGSFGEPEREYSINDLNEVGVDLTESGSAADDPLLNDPPKMPYSITEDANTLSTVFILQNKNPGLIRGSGNITVYSYATTLSNK